MSGFAEFNVFSANKPYNILFSGKEKKKTLAMTGKDHLYSSQLLQNSISFI